MTSAYKRASWLAATGVTFYAVGQYIIYSAYLQGRVLDRAEAEWTTMGFFGPHHDIVGPRYRQTNNMTVQQWYHEAIEKAERVHKDVYGQGLFAKVFRGDPSWIRKYVEQVRLGSDDA